MPKKKAKTKAGKKVIQKQKQTVIVNVTKRGGGKSKGRASAPRPQQIPQVIFQQPQQQFPQYERTQERPHTNERERSHVDEILNVVQRANNIYRQQPLPQAITTTNVDVGQILTGTAALAKTGLDIYRNYSRGQQEQKQEQQREERRVEVPRANQSDIPAIPPRPVRPIPVPAQPQTPKTPRRVLPPVPLFPPTPASAPAKPVPAKPVPVPPAEQILKPAQTPQLPRRAIKREGPERPPRSSSTGGIKEKDIKDRDNIERRLAILNPNIARGNPVKSFPVIQPAPSLPAQGNLVNPSSVIGGQRGVPAKFDRSSHEAEMKKLVSSSSESSRKTQEVLKKVSLGQMGARSILGQEEKQIERIDNSDFYNIAKKLRREGIAMGRAGKENIRQNKKAKSAPASREIPSGPPIGGKRRSDLELRNPRKTQLY